MLLEKKPRVFSGLRLLFYCPTQTSSLRYIPMLFFLFLSLSTQEFLFRPSLKQTDLFQSIRPVHHLLLESQPGFIFHGRGQAFGFMRALNAGFRRVPEIVFSLGKNRVKISETLWLMGLGFLCHGICLTRCV